MRLTRIAEAARRNFFDIVSKLPNKGIGLRVHRKTWEDNSYWTVQRVQTTLDGRHGKAYGLLTWRGKEAEKPTRINGVLKQVWRAVDSRQATPWKEVNKPALDPKGDGAAEQTQAQAAATGV